MILKIFLHKTFLLQHPGKRAGFGVVELTTEGVEGNGFAWHGGKVSDFPVSLAVDRLSLSVENCGK